MNDIKFFGIKNNHLIFENSDKYPIAFEIKNINEYNGEYISLWNFKRYITKNRQNEIIWDFKNDNIITKKYINHLTIYNNIKSNSELVISKNQLKDILIDEIGLDYQFNCFCNDSELIIHDIQFIVIFEVVRGIKTRIVRNIINNLIKNPEISKMDKQDMKDFLAIIVENIVKENR